MKKTKPINILLGFILLAMLIAIFAIWNGSRLTASVTHISAQAADYPTYFSDACEIVSADAAVQTFAKVAPESTTGYYLVYISIDLKNQGMLSAEWVTAKLNPAEGDIAVYESTGQECDVPHGSSGSIDMKLLTRMPEGSRSITIHYYSFGIERTTTVNV